MKKIISLLLAVMMVASCVCLASAEEPASSYQVKTTAQVSIADKNEFSYSISTYNDTTSFDFKATVDMTNVKNGVTLAKSYVAQKYEGITFDTLGVTGSFTVEVTYDEKGITAPDFTAAADALTIDTDLFTLGTPTVSGGKLSVTATLKSGATAKDLSSLPGSIAIIAKGFTVPNKGEYTLTGTMKGSAAIANGSATVQTISFSAVNENDETAPISVTVENAGDAPESTGSSSSRPSTSKPATTPSTGTEVKGEGESVKVDTSVKGSTASVKDITSSDIEKATGDDSSLSIDVTGASKKDVDTVKLTEKTVDAISESDVENVEISLSGATVEVSSDAVDTIKESASGDVSISVKEGNLNDKQKEAVKELGGSKTVDATVTSGGKSIEVTVTVTVEYKAEKEGFTLAATVSADGTLNEVPVAVEDGKAKVEAGNDPVVIWTVPKEDAFVLTIDKKDASVFGASEDNDVAPKIVNDRTMLPARFVAEKLGAKVEWDEETRTVTITKDNVKITITIDSKVATVNGEEQELDSPAFIENDRTYTPIRFISEQLGAKVNWNGATQQVVITK